METETHILFYGHGDTTQYNIFSNFFPCKFVDPSYTGFNCSEQYFMYQKALLFDPTNKQIIDTILKETDPHKIKKLGRMVQNYDETKWASVRFQKMFEANYYKFTQNNELLEALLNTGTKILVEASPRDKIWGAGLGAKTIVANGYKFPGQNLLGKVLMITRDKLKKIKS